MPLPLAGLIAKVAIKGMIKGAVKGAVRVGVKQTIKGAAKKTVKKKLTARNIKSNLLKKRDKLKKLQLQRDRQQTRETVEESSSNEQESKKGDNILGKKGGFLGKIIKVTLMLLVGFIIAKLRGFANAIGKVINVIKPIWDIIMGALSKMVGGIVFIFKAAGGIMGLGKKNRELEQAKTSMIKSNEGVNKELEKQEFSGEQGKDEEQEDKKDEDKKDKILSQALKESSDFIQAQDTMNKVDDKQDQSSKSISKESVLGRVNKVVKSRGDKAKSKLSNQSPQISPAIKKEWEKANKNKLGRFDVTKSVNGGLGPTQKQKNKGKVIVQPVEKVVRVGGGGGGGSSGGGGDNTKSPVGSSSGNTMGLP